jgi:hypothetical protein
MFRKICALFFVLNLTLKVLQDRMEAANALKKQMWAEAQLDKSRLKEEIMSKSDFGSSFVGSKAETQPTSTAVGGSQSPLLNVDDQNEASPSTAENQNLLGSQSIQDHLNIMPAERIPLAQDFSMGPDNFLVQQLGSASKRTRSQLKSYIAHRAEEMYVYRSLPLGQDRRRNRYWQFVASASSSDPGSGRIFIELQDGNWRLIDSEEVNGLYCYYFSVSLLIYDLNLRVLCVSLVFFFLYLV